LKPTSKPDSRLPILAIRTTPERRKKIKQWIANHDIPSLQEFIENAVDVAMGEKQTKRPKNAPTIEGSIQTDLDYNLKNPEYRDLVRFVIEIFNSDKQDDINGLIFNILAFKRGDKFDQLYALLVDFLQTLKQQGVSPDASFIATVSEATDFTRTLARARHTLEHLRTSEEGSGKTRPKRIG